MFKAGDKVAVKYNRAGSKEIYGPRIVAACKPRYEGGPEQVRIFCNGQDEKGGWVEYNAETGRDGGSPGHTILPWTPEVKAAVRLYEMQSEVARLTSEARETQWHRELTLREANKLIQWLKPVRERVGK